jgi:hypothetical protein
LGQVYEHVSLPEERRLTNDQDRVFESTQSSATEEASATSSGRTLTLLEATRNRNRATNADATGTDGPKAVASSVLSNKLPERKPLGSTDVFEGVKPKERIARLVFLRPGSDEIEKVRLR